MGAMQKTLPVCFVLAFLLLVPAIGAFGQTDNSVRFSVSDADGSTVIEGRLADGYVGEFDFSGTLDAQRLQRRNSSFDPVLVFERTQPVAALEEGVGTIFLFASSTPIEFADWQGVPAAGATRLTMLIGAPRDGVRNDAFVMLLHNDGERIFFSSVHDQTLTVDEVTVDEHTGRVDGRVYGTFELVGVSITPDGTPDFDDPDPSIIEASFATDFSSALTDQDVTMLTRPLQ